MAGSPFPCRDYDDLENTSVCVCVCMRCVCRLSLSCGSMAQSETRTGTFIHACRVCLSVFCLEAENYCETVVVECLKKQAEPARRSARLHGPTIKIYVTSHSHSHRPNES
jgi:hypothetical protein